MVDSMTAGEALEIYDLLDSGGVRCWVVGGWEVDALLGFTTRSHKDLDLLVHRADIAAYCAITREAGFGRKLELGGEQLPDSHDDDVRLLRDPARWGDRWRSRQHTVPEVADNLCYLPDRRAPCSSSSPVHRTADVARNADSPAATARLAGRS